MGKTALAMNIAENVAVSGSAVAIFSIEMSGEMISQRFISKHTGIPVLSLRSGSYVTDDWLQKINNFREYYADLPIILLDKADITPLDILSYSRHLQHSNDIKLIIIDYLQLVHVPGNLERLERVSRISRYMKLLARELKIPVIVVSQLNRAPEIREDHRPRLSDLRESGTIEQDADTVVLISREDWYQRQRNPDYQPKNTAEVIIAKQRQGPTDSFELDWHGGTMEFTNKDNYY